MRRILMLVTLSLIFFLVIPNTLQIEKQLKLEKLEPKLRTLVTSDEKVRVIVWLEKDKTSKDFDRIGRVRHKYSIIPAIAMEVSSRRLEDLAELSNVKKVVIDRKVRILRMQSIPQIKADVASSNFIVNGTGINISIIDTGILNHTEFQTPNRIVKQKCYCDVSPGNCCPGGLNESNNATDDHGHGTHCAGIAGGEGDGSGQGVATNASLFAVKVINSTGWGSDSDIIAGIDWAVNNKANVISLSLGTDYDEFNDCYEVLSSDAVDNATKQGVVVVVAAGNEGAGGSGTISAPGCAKRAITVGAVYDSGYGPGITDFAPLFTSEGPTNDNRTKPDLVAPGVNITSTYHTSPTAYDTQDGTSMATPHVAGVAALLIQEFNQTFGYFPGPDRVKAILLTAVNTTGLTLDGWEQRNRVYGAGRIDAYEALRIMNNTRNGTISQDQTHRYNLNVTDDLILTLYWPEDRYTNNDLNLVVGNRSYNYSYPTDANDSVEQIFLYNNSHRIWKVYIEGITGSDQEYYLASNMEIIDDVTPPALILTKPENKTYSTQIDVPLNFTTDSSNKTIWYTINDVNETGITGNTTFNVSSDGSYKIILHVNDSYDNINKSVQYFSVDTTPPKYFDNSTNNTVAGIQTEFRLRWTDNVGLGGYVFSFDNCTGNFVNDSWVTMTGTGNWSNVTKVINSTLDCTIRWRVYANDTVNNWNSSQAYSFNTTEDLTSPIWYGNKTAPVSPTYSPGNNYQFNVTWVDDIHFDTALIEHNFTGTFDNYSFTGNVNSEYYYNYNVLPAGIYQWRSFGNDTNGNRNVTDTWTYVVNQNTSTQDFMSLTLDGSESNQTVAYSTTTNATGWYSIPVFTGQNITFTLYRNGSQLGNTNPVSDVVQLGTGDYNYTYHTDGNINYSSATKQFFLSVNKAPTEIELYLDGTRGNESYLLDGTANFTVVLNVTDKYVNLTYNISGLVELTGLTPLINITNLPTVGTYNITGYWLGDENYTPDTETWFATVATTTTTTTTTTLGGNGNGDGDEENETVTVNVTLVPGVLLGDDEDLQSAIEEILDEDELSLEEIEDLIDNSQTITPDVDVTRSFTKETNSSLTTHLEYDGGWEITNFIVYDIISKNFSQYSDNITVSESANDWEVVEEDPSYVFLYSAISTGDEIDIVYEVDEDVDSDVIDEMSTYVFAESLETATTTSTTTSITTTTLSSGAECGNEACETGEDCDNCPDDCSCPEGLVCEDGDCVLKTSAEFNWVLLVIPIIIGVGGVIGYRFYGDKILDLIKGEDEFEKLKKKWGGERRRDFERLKRKWSRRPRR